MAKTFRTQEEEEVARTLGASLRKLRGFHDWPASSIAQSIGISRDFLYKLERGEREPSLIILKRLAILFGVTIDHLVWGGPQRQRLSPLAQAAPTGRIQVRTQDGTIIYDGPERRLGDLDFPGPDRRSA